MSEHTWTQAGKRWTLDASPRYAVESRGTRGYAMLIDGYEVDTEPTLPRAREHLAAVYEYEAHAVDLKEARHRLEQARERISRRFLSAAKDPALASMLSALSDALGAGPAASPPDGRSDRYRRGLAPDLTVVLDASCCVVLEIADTYGRPVRRVTVGDLSALHSSLDEARALRDAVEAEDEKRRYECIAEHRRAQGRFTRIEAVDHLVDVHHAHRPHAVAATGTARRNYQAWAERNPARKPTEADVHAHLTVGETRLLVSFDGEYWGVRPSPDNP